MSEITDSRTALPMHGKALDFKAADKRAASLSHVNRPQVMNALTRDERKSCCITQVASINYSTTKVSRCDALRETRLMTSGACSFFRIKRGQRVQWGPAVSQKSANMWMTAVGAVMLTSSLLLSHSCLSEGQFFTKQTSKLIPRMGRAQRTSNDMSESSGDPGLGWSGERLEPPFRFSLPPPDPQDHDYEVCFPLLILSHDLTLSIICFFLSSHFLKR